MKNKVLTSIQVLLFLFWAIASHSQGDGINLFVFNILPIPNFSLGIITFALIGIGYWLQGLKDKKKI